MSSKNEVFAAFDALDDAWRRIAAQPIHTLHPADRRALFIRHEATVKKGVELQRQILAGLLAGPPPVEFAGASWAEVLARRLRISVGEAQRRVDEAGRSVEPRSA
jgi:hypothetical protein